MLPTSAKLHKTDGNKKANRYLAGWQSYPYTPKALKADNEY